jgi:DHA1 family bicyclomycin/chloramphenicol resistance-like MFS transporter
MLITYIVLLAFSMSLIPYTIDPYLPAFPAMGEFFGVPNATIQASFAGVTVGLAAGHLFSGPLSDAFGRRPLLLISTFGFAASAIASTKDPSGASFVPGHFSLEQPLGCTCTVVAADWFWFVSSGGGAGHVAGAGAVAWPPSGCLT